MAYYIEWAGDRDGGAYLEIAIKDAASGAAYDGYGIDLQLVVNEGNNPADAGQWSSGEILASQSNDRITTNEAGVYIINIPPSALQAYIGSDYGFYRRGQQSVRCKLLAVTENTEYTRKLADVVLSFGGNIMAGPRVTVRVYPYYPIMPGDPAFSTGSVQVSQLKIQLAAMSQYDAVEAALPALTEPATILWNSGGTIEFGGDLSDIVQGVLGYSDNTMQNFLLICSQITT